MPIRNNRISKAHEQSIRNAERIEFLASGQGEIKERTCILCADIQKLRACIASLDSKTDIIVEKLSAGSKARQRKRMFFLALLPVIGGSIMWLWNEFVVRQ